MPLRVRVLLRHAKVSRTRWFSAAASEKPYSFHIGASFEGKPDWGDEPPSLHHSFPPSHPILPFREKMVSWKRQVPSQTPGEDFFYVQNMRNDSGVSIGVADGVGGWKDTVDPSLFSQSMMYNASLNASQSWPGEPVTDPIQEDDIKKNIGRQLLPQECMRLAHQAVLRDPAILGGASTACIINMDAISGRLRAANLGDSGFYIIRGTSLLHAQPPQTHFFNCPLQLSKFPSNFPKHLRLDDYAKDAATYSTTLRHGDVVIAYTDGLSDNVFKGEIIGYTNSILRRGGTSQERAQHLADFLVLYARRCMYDYGRVSPFEIESAQHHGEAVRHKGGKIDELVTFFEDFVVLYDFSH